MPNRLYYVLCLLGLAIAFFMMAGSVARDSQTKILRSIVYGGFDGIVTTFALVSGADAMQLDSQLVFVMGSSTLFADAISMAVGDYMSSKAEKECEDKIMGSINHAMDNGGLGELKQGLIDSYEKQGLSTQQANDVLTILLAHPKAIRKALFQNALEKQRSESSSSDADIEEIAVASGIYTFISFIVCGSVPIVVYVFLKTDPERVRKKEERVGKEKEGRDVEVMNHTQFVKAVVVTGLALFGLGVFKSYSTNTYWLYSGLTMMALGELAAVVAYVISSLIFV